MKLASNSLLVLCACLASWAWAGPDEEVLGKSANYPVGTASTWYNNPYRVGSWSGLNKVPGVQTRTVARSAEFIPLPRADKPATISYTYRNLRYTLADYMDRQRTSGLLVLKNGEIVAEHYGYDRTDDARFISFSMAKSVTSLLVGIAVSRGHIASLDDPAEKYVQSLAGSPYGATRIRDLLRMSSGLTFTERYDGRDDIARLSRADAGVTREGTPTDVLRSITDRHAPAGTKFVYASAETSVLGRVLTAATGKTQSELTSEWLWKPMGAEHEAFWRVGADGQEQSYGSFHASLRDWGRLGLLLARDGQVLAKTGAADAPAQLVPREYLLDATDPARAPQDFKPRKATPYLGYGYQFWLLPLRERTFAFQGIHGQAIYVQPGSGIVLVLTSVWENASGRTDPAPFQERDALWRGVLRSLGGSTEE